MQRSFAPVTLISGFLGAGKTTFLNNILADPQGVRYGVLINDFGAVNIDADLVVESAADQVTLENGCVCCTIRNDLTDALAALLDRPKPPEHIIIEASGVSRPLPIADALDFEGIAGRVTLNGIFCLVDAAGFADLDFVATELALDQAAGADVIVVNKVDIATPQQVDTVDKSLKGALPRARIIHSTNAQVPRDLVFGMGKQSETNTERNGQPHHHNIHDHGDEFEAWHWRSEAAVDPNQLRAAVRALPTSLLRAKGVLRLTDGSRLVFHLVGKRSEIFRQEKPAPETSTVVAIGRRGHFDAAALLDIFNGCAV